MAELDLPNHVVSIRRDGRREVLLHRSMAVIGPDKIEIKSARSTIVLPLVGIALAGGAIAWIALSQGAAPLWALVLVVFACLFRTGKLLPDPAPSRLVIAHLCQSNLLTRHDQ